MGCGIYKISNKKNGKIYIGSSVDVDKRWLQHKINLIENNHYNSDLQQDYNKYGKEAFEFKTMKEVDEENLRWQELEAIELYSWAYRLYNAPNIKDKIVYRICKYLEELGAEFTIDLKIEIDNKRYNINLYCLVNGVRVFVNLRDESFFHDKKAKEKAADSFAKKAEWVARENGYITEFYYSPDIDDDSVNKIVADAIDYINLILGSEFNE